MTLNPDLQAIMVDEKEQNLDDNYPCVLEARYEKGYCINGCKIYCINFLC